MIANCGRSFKIYFFIRKRSGASENFWHAFNSLKNVVLILSVWERARKTDASWRFFTASRRKWPCSSPPLSLSPSVLSVRALSQNKEKNELEDCKHGGDGWHFPKLCLAISCGSRASRPLRQLRDILFLWWQGLPAAELPNHSSPATNR